jgi:AraC-like DNA-binding protein
VILDRARNAPIPPEHVDLLAHTLGRMMVTIPITLAAICLAQHTWLAGDARSVARLRAALQTLGRVGEVHALLLLSFQSLWTESVHIERVLTLLDRALLFREPLTTPYYVVMAARLVHDHRLPAARLVGRIRAHPRLADLPRRARWVIEAAALALRAEPRAELPPDDLRQAVAAQVHGPSRTTPRAASSSISLSSLEEHPVTALKQLIDTRWFEQVSFEAFARNHNVSRYTISRRFKSLLGRSPRQYLQETRIDQAKRKLVETDGTLTDIALGCGFTDATQFSRLFKEATGMTPGRYREARRQPKASPDR